MFLSRAEPATLPFSMDDLKRHCRVDSDYTDDDAILELYAWAAIKQGEFSSNRVWVESDWTGELDRFPGGAIEIPKSPCTSVTEVSYTDAAGTAQTLPTYALRPSTLMAGGGRPYASLEPMDAWPAGAKSVVISFKAGWPSADFPKDLVEWICVKVSSHYEQREDLASATRKIAIAFPRHFVDALLDAYYLPRY